MERAALQALRRAPWMRIAQLNESLQTPHSTTLESRPGYRFRTTFNDLEDVLAKIGPRYPSLRERNVAGASNRRASCPLFSTTNRQSGHRLCYSGVCVHCMTSAARTMLPLCPIHPRLWTSLPRRTSALFQTPLWTRFYRHLLRGSDLAFACCCCFWRSIQLSTSANQAPPSLSR
jgi:hypothetical protein